MVSIKTERCNTPRPKTKNLSAASVSSRRIAKFRSSSFSKRSLMCLEVTNFPSCPKKGESFIVKSMLMVGSSIAMVGRASGASKSAMVSPISKPSKPITAHRSPAATCSTFFRPKPSKRCNSLIRELNCVPSLLIRLIFILVAKCPRCSLPMAILPVKEEKSKEVMSICVFPSSILGLGTCSKTISNKGAIESVSFFQSVLIQLFFADP